MTETNPGAGHSQQPEPASQPSHTPLTEPAGQPTAAPPSGSYTHAPQPASAYPSPEAGGFSSTYAPPTSYASPGPGYNGQPFPPPPIYGSPQGSYQFTDEVQATDSLVRGWEIFKANPWPFVLSQVVWGLIFSVVLLVAGGVPLMLMVSRAASMANGDNPSYGGFVVSLLPFLIISIILGVLNWAAFISASLKAADGHRVGMGDFFTVPHFGRVLLLSLVASVASAVLAVTFIGPIVVMFYVIWAVCFVIDRDKSAFQALSASWEFTRPRLGQSAAAVGIAYGLNSAGLMACGLGVLVTNPLTLLCSADFYRRVTGPGKLSLPASTLEPPPGFAPPPGA